MVPESQLTCIRVIPLWYNVSRACGGHRDTNHVPEDDIRTLTVVVRVLLWTGVSQPPVEVVIISLWSYFIAGER